MKIKPVILCGGGGTRLWPESKKNIAKQFIDFGGWTLLQKTLLRIKSPIFDYPIISTNLSYLKLVHKYLQKSKIKKYKIIPNEVRLPFLKSLKFLMSYSIKKIDSRVKNIVQVSVEYLLK